MLEEVFQEAPGDAYSRVDPKANNYDDEGVQSAMDDKNAISSRLGVDIIGRGPTFDCFYRDVHSHSNPSQYAKVKEGLTSGVSLSSICRQIREACVCRRLGGWPT